MLDNDNYLLFRLVPTMKCNYSCSYCFLPGEEKKVATTMFDLHSPDEWVAAMRHFSGFDVEFYCWGGEPFVIDGTYELVRGWTAYDHVNGGSRIDTNMAFAEKIARLCPTDKVKLNCSWHTQYHSLPQIYDKVKLLNDLGMVGMLNFVASRENLHVLKSDYNMTLDGLVGTFADIGVFVNIAADFALVNGREPASYADYRDLILNYTSPEDWRQLRGEKKPALCRANRHFLTIQPNGDLTPCLSNRVCGNFFKGTLELPPATVCHNECPSIVAYPFRDDNDFIFRSHLSEYVARNRAYRESLQRQSAIPRFSPRATDLPEGTPATTAPKVSVVMPTCNQAGFLPRAVESLCGQTFGDFELIIVNDGSTDGTRDYLESLDDPRIRVIHQENRKLPRALNAGFSRARGELVTWVSSDNWCAPHFLETLAGALDANPAAGFAYSAFAWIDEQDRITGVHRDQNMNWYNLIKSNPGIASFLYRRECMEAVGPYDTELEGAEDWDMWLRIIERYATVYVPDLLYYYRVHDGSMTSQKQATITAAATATVKKAFARLGNEIDLGVAFPWLTLCSDQHRAETVACLELGSNLLLSPFAPAELAVPFLEAACSRMPGITCLWNLSLAYASAGLWEQTTECLRHLQEARLEDTDDMVIFLEQLCARRGMDTLPQLFSLQNTGEELFELEKRHRRIFSSASAAEDMVPVRVEDAPAACRDHASIATPDQAADGLTEIGPRYDTDKSKAYLASYESHFSQLRDKPVKLLELGINKGGSLYLWRDYFPRGTIVGLDINRVDLEDPSGKIQVYQGDQACVTTLDRIRQECAPEGFDIIIDDASHIAGPTRQSFRHLFDNHLKPGGWYVIEDWGTGYWESWADGARFQPGRPHVAGMVGFVKELVDETSWEDISKPGLGIEPPRSSAVNSLHIRLGQAFVQKSARGASI